MTKPTDPMLIQYIVEQELLAFNNDMRQKMLKWTQDTRYRAIKWTDQALKALGIATTGLYEAHFATAKVQIVSKPVPTNPNVLKALNVNVINDIDTLSTDAKQRITRALIDGTTNGEGAVDLANRVQDVVDMPMYRAEMIARTETMKAFNDVAQDQYAKYGVTQVQWLATNDERECEECAAHDGQTYSLDAAPDIPAHPNCRCITIPVIPEVS